MVSPQLENGYIRIATEIWEALIRVRIPGYSRQCLDVIIRKTYGWNKKEDEIAISQFSISTGIDKSNVVRALKQLENMKIIVVKKDTYMPNKYSINKHYSTWKPLLKKTRGVSKKNNDVVKIDKKPLSKKTNTINITTINTNTINMFEQFWNTYPKRKAKKDALKAFVKITPSERLLNEMIISIEMSKKTEDWKKKKGKYIPLPATWINGERWNDEVIVEETLAEKDARMEKEMEGETFNGDIFSQKE